MSTVYKSIAYAYPTSEFGGKDGGYYVEQYASDNQTPRKASDLYASHDDPALLAALAGTDGDVCPYALRFHPERYQGSVAGWDSIDTPPNEWLRVSWVCVIRNADGSVIRGTGMRELRSCRMASPAMAADFAYATVKEGQCYSIEKINKRPEIWRGGVCQ